MTLRPDLHTSTYVHTLTHIPVTRLGWGAVEMAQWVRVLVVQISNNHVGSWVCDQVHLTPQLWGQRQEDCWGLLAASLAAASERDTVQGSQAEE